MTKMVTNHTYADFPRRVPVKVFFWCPMLRARPVLLTSDYEHRGDLRVVLGGAPFNGVESQRPFDQHLNAVDGAANVEKMDPVLMSQSVFFEVINVGEMDIRNGQLFLTWRQEK